MSQTLNAISNVLTQAAPGCKLTLGGMLNKAQLPVNAQNMQIARQVINNLIAYNLVAQVGVKKGTYYVVRTEITWDDILNAPKKKNRTTITPLNTVRKGLWKAYHSRSQSEVVKGGNELEQAMQNHWRLDALNAGTLNQTKHFIIDSLEYTLDYIRETDNCAVFNSIILCDPANPTRKDSAKPDMIIRSGSTIYVSELKSSNLQDSKSVTGQTDGLMYCVELVKKLMGDDFIVLPLIIINKAEHWKDKNYTGCVLSVEQFCTEFDSDYNGIERELAKNARKFESSRYEDAKNTCAEHEKQFATAV